MPHVQDAAARGHAVHHGPLHQLRHDHRAQHAQAAGALDQARGRALLRSRLLILPYGGGGEGFLESKKYPFSNKVIGLI